MAYLFTEQELSSTAPNKINRFIKASLLPESVPSRAPVTK